MRTRSFAYSRPDSLDEALQALGDGGTALAGGQSLLQSMKLGLREPAHLVDLAGLRGLDTIEQRDGGLEIGALTRIRDVAASSLLRSRVPWLADAARHVGDVQVRNRGTIGGNVCFADPRSNLAAALIALGAYARVAGLQGEREIPIDELFLGFRRTSLHPSELVTTLLIAGDLDGARGAYLELARQPNGVPIVNASVTVRPQRGVTVGVGGLANLPLRAREVETALAERELDDQTITRACALLDRDGADALEDIHGSAAYRSRVARVLVRRAIGNAANDPSGGTDA
jgi:carbon-monoxide dehydrogenase medium subunit